MKISRLISILGPGLALSANVQAKDPFSGYSIANIAISTPNHDKMIEWYSAILGFRLVEQSEGVGSTRLALSKRDGVSLGLIHVKNMEVITRPKELPNLLETPGSQNIVFWVDDLKLASATPKTMGLGYFFKI